MIAGRTIKNLLRLDVAIWKKIGVDLDSGGVGTALDFVDFNTGMEYVNRLIDGSNSTISLRDITNPIIDVQVRALTVYSA